MAGEMLADDNSPMMMTVGQYNDRVAYTWKLAIESEQERIIKLLEKHNCILDGCHHSDNLCNAPNHLGLLIELIKGETI